MSNVKVIFSPNDMNSFVNKGILLESTIYARIEEKHKADKNVPTKIARAISKYRDRNIRLLASPYITQNILFLDSDMKLIYDLFDLSQEECQTLIKEVKLPQGIQEKPNFKPFPVVCLMLLRYYMKTKNEKMINVITCTLSYWCFWSVYTKFFRRTPIREATMKLAVNNMSKKFLIKSTGSVEGALVTTAKGFVTKYEERILRGSDNDMMLLCDDLRNRMSGMVRSIANAYFETYTKGDMMFTSIEDGDEGQLIETSGGTNDVDVLATNATNKFFNSGVNRNMCKYAAKIANTSEDGLRSAIEHLIDQKKEKGRSTEMIQNVRDFYNAIFLVFLKDGHSANDVRSMKFIPLMDIIYRKGNSQDPNIEKIKLLLDQWLEEGSASYRRASSTTTKNGFRRGIFLYMVQVASKA